MGMIHEWIMGIGYAIMNFFAGIDGTRLVTSLTIAGVGMLGIFVVIGIVVLFVLLLNKVFSK